MLCFCAPVMNALQVILRFLMARLAVQPVNTLVVDAGVLGAQHVVDHAVAPAPSLMRGLHNALQQFLV